LMVGLLVKTGRGFTDHARTGDYAFTGTQNRKKRARLG